MPSLRRSIIVTFMGLAYAIMVLTQGRLMRTLSNTPQSSSSGSQADDAMIVPHLEERKIKKKKHDYGACDLLPVMEKPLVRPAFSDIVRNWTFFKSPNWLLDFAVVGFPKCGTSTMMRYLNIPNVSASLQDEQCFLSFNQDEPFVKDLYDKLPSDPPHLLRGIKCPQNLESDHALHNFQTLFPRTKLIVGVRHPILWFQSFYNFRVNNYQKMIPANECIGRCLGKTRSTCTDRGRFHYSLARLGKTLLNDPEELKLLRSHNQKDVQAIRRSITNFTFLGSNTKVFLYDTDQLAHDIHTSSHHNITEESARMAKQFREDLRCFLGLPPQIELPPMIQEIPGIRYSAAKQAEIDKGKINICDDTYIELRKVLLDHGTKASRWIRHYFLQSKDVFVSQREEFEKILQTWEHDPCTTNQIARSSATTNSRA
uniref:Sulfotransferase domain-containing protein n=1 Tax=Attheya septentrionalis TaxID=420275 RepID=A0A7S2UE60_9STRA|mmetsp:Transcript_2172/g.3946  ORF Transcript_2172/g.3946 Transcript_2172/m.3946 type:complete len:427 (+) Transcript_2172:180-1460(+)